LKDKPIIGKLIADDGLICYSTWESPSSPFLLYRFVNHESALPPYYIHHAYGRSKACLRFTRTVFM